jgi:hypothetical protein
MTRPFHLALPTSNLSETVTFYTSHLNVEIGRRDATWVDFNLFGHQLVFHEFSGATLAEFKNPVDNKSVPVPHFGVILTPADWQLLATKLESHKIEWIIEPYTRFKGEVGEQSTLFFKDNNGYNLEFKAFGSDSQIFEA